jgi:hypothetical protein
MSLRNQKEFLCFVSYALKCRLEVIKLEMSTAFSEEQFQMMLSGTIKLYSHSVYKKKIIKYGLLHQLLLIKKILSEYSLYEDIDFSILSIYYCCCFLSQIVTIENEKKAHDGCHLSSFIKFFGNGLTTRTYFLLLQRFQSRIKDLKKQKNSELYSYYVATTCKLSNLIQLLLICKEKPLNPFIEKMGSGSSTEGKMISLPLIIYNGLQVEESVIKMWSLKLLGILTAEFDLFCSEWLKEEYHILDLILFQCAFHVLDIHKSYFVQVKDCMEDWKAEEYNFEIECCLVSEAIFAFVSFINQHHQILENASHLEKECTLLFSWVYMISSREAFDSQFKNEIFSRLSDQIRSYLSHKLPNFVTHLKQIYHEVLVDVADEELTEELICQKLTSNMDTRDRLLSNCQQYWEEFCDKEKDKFQSISSPYNSNSSSKLISKRTSSTSSTRCN